MFFFSFLPCTCDSKWNDIYFMIYIITKPTFVVMIIYSTCIQEMISVVKSMKEHAYVSMPIVLFPQL